MKHELVTLNHVQTHLIIYGDPFECDGKDVIVCITGNPGIPDFYIEFAAELHKSTGLPLVVIGKSFSNKPNLWAPLKRSSDWYFVGEILAVFLGKKLTFCIINWFFCSTSFCQGGCRKLFQGHIISSYRQSMCCSKIHSVCTKLHLNQSSSFCMRE